MIIRCTGCFECYDDVENICPYCGRHEGDPAQELFQLEPGTVIRDNLEDRYIIGNLINFGGFGITYKAWDIRMEKVVAIKEHFPSQGGLAHRVPGTKTVAAFNVKRKAEYEASVQRFKAEAHFMAKFNSHKNIVNVFNCCEDNGTAYLHMEFLDGLNLNEYLKTKGGKLSVGETLTIAFAVIDALKDVHKAGVLHRDIAPDNIFITKDGDIKLIDFGAARFGSAAEKTLILKVGYAPPEQYNTESSQGTYTDIYALGATLYNVLTGVKPVESTNRKNDDNNTVDPLEEPKKLDSSIPSFLSDTIMRAMAIDSNLRFQNVYELEKALRKKKKPGTIAWEKRKRKIKRVVLASAAACAVLCVALGFGAKVVEKQNEVVLQPASLVLWCPESDNSDLQAAFEAVAEEFSRQQPNVNIEVVGIPDEDYYNALSRATDGNQPNLFILEDIKEKVIYGDYDISQNIIPEGFFDKYTSTLTQDCYFFKNYYDYFPGGKLIPLGFNVPVVYVKLSRMQDSTEIQKIEQDTVSSLSELSLIALDEAITVNPAHKKQFINMYSNGMSTRSGYAGDFYEGNAKVYFSSSAEDGLTLKLVNDGVGMRKVLIPVGNSIPAYFSLLFGMNSFSKPENVAAEAFVEFLLTNNIAQNILFKQESVGALPLNKRMAEEFSGENYNGYFKPVYDNIDSYTFEW